MQTDLYKGGCYGSEKPHRRVDHPADYRLSGEDLAVVARGLALFISGRALAKAAFLADLMGSQELLFYWTSERGAAGLITDLIIPEQRTTAGMCVSEGQSVLRASRQARKLGRYIVAAGHSHGRSAVFSSGTDRRLMGELANERVGHSTYLRRKAQGRLAEAAAGPEGQARQLEATFPDAPECTVRLGVARPDVSAQDLTVELVREIQGMTVTFSTHNAYGEHYFPMHRVRICPTCQAREEATRSSDQVTLHVVGPEEITAEEKQALRKEVESKVQRGYLWEGTCRPSTWPATAPVAATLPAGEDTPEPGEVGICGAEATVAADFEVYQRGCRVGRIPAAVVEEAAFRVPALARALGWTEYGQTSQEAGHEPDRSSDQTR